MTLLDCSNKTFSIDPVNGLVRIDGVPAFKILFVGDECRIQFQDNDRLRSQYRGSRFIEIPLAEFVERLKEIAVAGM